jgi:hypothetical protein
MLRVGDVVYYTRNGEDDTGLIIGIDDGSDWPLSIEFSDGVDHYKEEQVTLLRNARD